MSESESASESESGCGSESGSEFGPTPRRHPGGTQEAPRRLGFPPKPGSRPMHMFIHIGKDNPIKQGRHKEGTKEKQEFPRMAHEAPKTYTGHPKGTQESAREPNGRQKGATKNAKARQKMHQKMHKASQRHHEGHRKEPSGPPLGPKGTGMQKQSKRPPFRGHFWSAFGVRCTCNPRTPVQSKHLKSQFIPAAFLNHFLTKRWDCRWKRGGATRGTPRKRGEPGGTQEAPRRQPAQEVDLRV